MAGAKVDASYGPMRTRLASTWYKLKYSWLYSSGFDIGKEPLFLLGKCYSSAVDYGSADLHGDSAPTHIKAFVDHFVSITWLTYRKNFPPLEGTRITTDCGWGCMVRSGQMLLATALSYHLLGCDWRFVGSSKKQRLVHRQILTWFEDHPGSPGTCPFALHQLMEVASNYGYSPGNWFGPAQVAVLLRDSLTVSRNHHPLLHNLMVYLAKDCTIYLKDIAAMYANEPTGDNTGLMVLVPIRLGGDSLNIIYVPCIKALLATDHCIGIIGGRPKHSVYFVGFQDHKLLYLDPHYVQKSLDMSNPEFDMTSFHTHLPQKMHAVNMDPSCTLGFYCRTRQDFELFYEETRKVVAPPLQRGHYPFFTFSEKCMSDLVLPVSYGAVVMPTGQRHNSVDGDTGNHGDSEDEFIVINCPKPPCDKEQSSGDPVETLVEGSSDPLDYLLVGPRDSKDSVETELQSLALAAPNDNDVTTENCLNVVSHKS